jgi:hypothetical protein
MFHVKHYDSHLILFFYHDIIRDLCILKAEYGIVIRLLGRLHPVVHRFRIVSRETFYSHS